VGGDEVVVAVVAVVAVALMTGVGVGAGAGAWVLPAAALAVYMVFFMYTMSLFSLFISAHKCMYSSDFKVDVLTNRPGSIGLVVPCVSPSVVELDAVVARARPRGVRGLCWRACPRSAPRRLVVFVEGGSTAPKIKAD